MRRWGNLVASVAAMSVVLFAFKLDMGFYNPQKGRVEEGEKVEVMPERPRHLLELTVDEDLERRLGSRVSLYSLIEYYGLEEDTLPCSVAQNFPNAAREKVPDYASRTFREGETVTLCLN